MPTLVKLWRKLAVPAIVLWVAAGLVLPSHAQPPDPAQVGDPLFKVTQKHSDLKIIERFAKVVELQAKITQVDGFDPEVIEVTAMTPNRVRVQAVAPGITTMVVVDEKGKMYSINVFVTGDVRYLQAYIRQLFPNASVTAVEVRDSVVLRGWVTQPEHITELVEIAEQFYPQVINQIRVGGVQQVLLKVKVMEVQRSKIRKLGFNFLYLNQNGYFASTPGQLVPLAGLTVPFGVAPSLTVNQNALTDPSITFGVVNVNNVFNGFLEALKEEGLLKIRAEPTLVTMNGRPATLLNGGEFPILVPQSLGTSSIEWREFGVKLEAVPIILGNGRLRLELSPEVSERDFTNSVTFQGIVVPGLTTRRVNTQVEMKFGQTLIIAGLISSRNTSSTHKVPFLGELPWIGAAFSRKSYDEVETELVIMVTPEFVAPLDAEQVPRGGPGLFTDEPTDRELFHGFMEVPLYGDRCEGCEIPVPGTPLPNGYPLRPSLSPRPSGAGKLVPAPAGNGPAVPPAPRATGDEDKQTPHSTRLPSNTRLKSIIQTGDNRHRKTSQIRQPSSNTPRLPRPGLIEPKPGLIQPSLVPDPVRK